MIEPAKPVLALIGANGMLAQMVRRMAPDDFSVHAFGLSELDLTDVAVVRSKLDALRPHLIINCAAYTNVDACESNADLAFSVNGHGPGILARVARELGATLVHISTDYVFSGTATQPYREDDATDPRSVYGHSKLAGEKAIINSGLERYFIIRTSWLYGPGGKNFVETMVRLGRERKELRVVADQFGSPTLTGDLTMAIFELIKCHPTPSFGIYHFTNAGVCSWHGFAEAILEEARKSGEPIITERVRPISTVEYPLPAPRPAYSVLATNKYQQATGAAVPAWHSSLVHYFRNER